MAVQKVARLPCKSSPRYRKCHACHAKDRGATSVLLRRRASADIYGGTESTTPATQNEPESLRCRKRHACHAKTAAPHQSYFVAKLPLTSMVVQKVPRLPRKSSLRCHAKDRGATSVLLRRKLPLTSIGGTESTTPATQIEPEAARAHMRKGGREPTN